MIGAKASILRYVLSAGRTGTVFLERLINDQADGVEAVHEPAATRYQMILANLRNDWGIGGPVLRRLFEASRDRRLQQAPNIFVEINPFLCPMTDLLPKKGHALRIVHMVRDPASWAASITTFKASTHFRSIIDHIPFAKPYPAPRPVGWRKLDDYDRALWRWRWCNERIEQLRDDAQAYALVRYEDIFCDEPAIQSEALATISTALALPGPLKADPQAMARRANPSEREVHRVDRAAAGRICGPMARAYGYDY